MLILTVCYEFKAESAADGHDTHCEVSIVILGYDNAPQGALHPSDLLPADTSERPAYVLSVAPAVSGVADEADTPAPARQQPSSHR